MNLQSNKSLSQDQAGLNTSELNVQFLGTLKKLIQLGCWQLKIRVGSCVDFTYSKY